MDLQEQFGLLVQSAVQKKDEEIKSLKEQIDKLKEENEKLKQNDPQVSSSRFDLKSKAETLKKALDDFLEYPNSNRPNHHQRLQPVFASVSIPSSNVDVIKPSTSTRPGPADEQSVNGPKYRNFNNNQEDFSSRQEFRTTTDEQIINQANPTDQHYHHHNNPSHNNNYAHTLPTTFLGNNSQKRFHPNSYNVNGTNNNNNNRYNRNNNNNNNKWTIFVSWPGVNVTKEQLHELFESVDIDVADIRYTAPKQFAHVDLKSEQALNKALLLNGETKNDKQGALRVEQGKPRSSNPNPTENGPRPQNQNKSYPRQNNKSTNGYNTNSPQKQNKYNNPNYANHSNHSHNNHSGAYPSFGASDDKENGHSWQSPNIDVTKQNGESN